MAEAVSSVLGSEGSGDLGWAGGSAHLGSASGEWKTGVGRRGSSQSSGRLGEAEDKTAMGRSVHAPASLGKALPCGNSFVYPTNIYKVARDKAARESGRKLSLVSDSQTGRSPALPRAPSAGWDPWRARGTALPAPPLARFPGVVHHSTHDYRDVSASV